MSNFSRSKPLYREKPLFVGMNVDDEQELRQHILNLREFVIEKGIECSRFVPIWSLHITLFEIHLHTPIMNQNCFDRFSNLLKDSADEIRNDIKTLKPTRFVYGEIGDSVKICFDKQSHNLLAKVQKKVTAIFKSANIGRLEESIEFYPHVTIMTRSRSNSPFEVNSEREIIKDCIENVNRLNKLPKFTPKVINVLLPRGHFSKHPNDKQYIKQLKKLKENL